MIANLFQTFLRVQSFLIVIFWHTVYDRTLKVILTSTGVNLTELDMIKEWSIPRNNESILNGYPAWLSDKIPIVVAAAFAGKNKIVNLDKPANSMIM